MKKNYQKNNGAVSPITIIVIFLLCIFTIFIIQNTAIVEIKFLFWKVSLSRVVLLLGALFTGILTGFFIGWEVTSKDRRSQR